MVSSADATEGEHEGGASLGGQKRPRSNSLEAISNSGDIGEAFVRVWKLETSSNSNRPLASPTPPARPPPRKSRLPGNGWTRRPPPMTQISPDPIDTLRSAPAPETSHPPSVRNPTLSSEESTAVSNPPGSGPGTSRTAMDVDDLYASSVPALGSPFVERPPPSLSCEGAPSPGPAFVGGPRTSAAHWEPDSVSGSRPSLPVRADRGRTTPPNCDAPPNAHSFSPTFLPTPTGGFPVIHRAHPDSLTRNLHPQQIQDWENLRASTTVAIQVFAVGYPSLESARTITHGLQTALVDLTRCPAVEVAAPIAARDANGDPLFPLPTTYLAYNLTEEVASRLKKQVCWSLNSISFFAYDFSPVIPDFLFTLRGFTSRNIKSLEHVIKRTIFSPECRLFTASFAVDNPRFHGLSTDSIAELLMESLRLKVVERSHSDVLNVNVYCASPTTSDVLWCRWRDVLGAAEFTHSFIGVGTRVVYLACSGCHGADHDIGNCPFTTLLGWNSEHALRE